MITAEAQLSEADLQRFAELIASRTGIAFGQGRRDAFALALVRAARDAGCSDLAEYHRLLDEERTESERWDCLIGHITVGETYFFRNESHFAALRQHILPDLIRRRRDQRRLRIWSAGCSTGEEPYSLAILLVELLPDISDWQVTILATDINRQALRAARRGRFREWSFRTGNPALRQRYFIEQDGHFELGSRVREMVTFAYLNLVEDVSPSLVVNTNAMDLIVWRNVLIYLSPEAGKGVAQRLHQCLVPGGWLIVGASETGAGTFREFEVHKLSGAIVYRKPMPAAPTHERKAKPVLPLRARPAVAVPAPFVAPVPERVAAVSADAGRGASFGWGMALAKAGRCAEAIQCFVAHLAKEPDCAAARHQMARMHANAGRLEEAEQWARKALDADPLVVGAHYSLALILQERGDLHGAVDRLKKVLYLDPSFVLAHFSLANLSQQLGRAGEAARHRRQAARLVAPMAPDEEVPESDGMTAGRLATMIRATETIVGNGVH